MSRLLTGIALVVLLVPVALVEAAKEPQSPMASDTTPTNSAGSSENPGLAPGTVNATIISSWTFDSGGAPDPQGWATLDRTFQPVFFHVELATFPSKGMWCGALTPCSVPLTCGYAALPGYGNNWEQTFASVPFNTNGGDVTVQFHIKFDTEPSYDNVYFEYASNGTWTTAGEFSGVGETTVEQLIEAADYSGPIRFRFRFYSDGIYSDEDGSWNSNYGAVVIDDIQIIEGVNTLDTQDFQTEPLGATATSDGDWAAYGNGFGNYAGLVAGNTVPQDDPLLTNNTHLWSFINGSTDPDACGGHPGQSVVPYKKSYEGFDTYIDNWIVSPTISIASFGPTEPVLLMLDVYADLPLVNLVFYQWWVRSFTGGTWGPWRNTSFNYYSNTPAWQTRTFDLRSRITPGAQTIQVALAAVDRCEVWCGIFGNGACHTHAPLIDNVAIATANTLIGPMVQSSPVDPTTGTQPVLLTFNQITEAGITSVTSLPTAGAKPYGSNVYYEVSTTATYTGSINVVITYVEADLLVPEASLKLLHWENGSWVNITTSINTTNNKIFGTTTSLSPFVLAPAIPTGAGALPGGLVLHQNIPNPFNPTTSIGYDVPAGGTHVSLRIYDATGRLVRELVDEHRPAGTHSASWDGRNAFGAAVASGVYFYRMEAGSFVDSKRMVLLK